MAQQPMKGTFSNPFSLTGEGGIFSDPSQLNQLAANPMFNMGMGLLSQKGATDPFGAMLGGLQSASTEAVAAQERARLDEQRKALQEWLKRQGIQADVTDEAVGELFGGQIGTTTQPFQTPGRYGGGLENRVLTDTVDDAVVERILGGF